MMEEVLKQIAAALERGAAAQEKMLELYIQRTSAVPPPKSETVEDDASLRPPVPTAEPATAADEVTGAERNEIKTKLAGMGFPSLPRLRGTSLRRMLAQAAANIAAGKPANAGMVGNIPFVPATPAVGNIPFAPATPAVGNIPFAPATPAVGNIPFVPATPAVGNIPFVPATPAAGAELPAPVAPTTESPAQSELSASTSSADGFDTPADKPVPTVEDVRQALREFSTKMAKKLGSDDAGITKAREVMAKFGVQRVSDLPEAKRSALIEALA